MIRSTPLLLVLLGVAAPLAAQVRLQPDPRPARTADWDVAGAQVRQLSAPRRPVAAQFDSLGAMPLGEAGDTVTLLLFDDGATLTRARTARIIDRQRFHPPASWRAACDDRAHPGWMFTLDAPATAAFAVVLPGALGMPVRRQPPPLAKSGLAVAYFAWADSAFRRYRAAVKPKTERADAFLWYSFYTDSLDAGLGRKELLGVRGPGGYNLAVFSAWLRDDYPDGTPNTTATWIVNGWGWTVARSVGNVDIYGTVDVNGDGIDEIATSSGLIRWDGTQWRFPPVYSDEPCLAHQVMPPPRGVRP